MTIPNQEPPKSHITTPNHESRTPKSHITTPNHKSILGYDGFEKGEVLEDVGSDRDWSWRWRREVGHISLQSLLALVMMRTRSQVWWSFLRSRKCMSNVISQARFHLFQVHDKEVEKLISNCRESEKLNHFKRKETCSSPQAWDLGQDLGKKTWNV